MQPGPLPAELIAAAPDISGRLGRILMALAALVAHAFLRDPRHVGLINPLWRYITRTARRFDSAITRLVAGKQRAYSPRPGRTTPSAPQEPRPRVRLPTDHAWLVLTLKHHAAGYGSQLNHLLSEPETAALIAACPQAARLLRPLCHLLGISPAAIQPPPRARRVGRSSATHHSPAPTEPPAEPTHRAPHPLLAATARPAALPPLYPGYPPPPCEHVTWWPWVPPRSERERLA
jgi:hypothetical protein